MSSENITADNDQCDDLTNNNGAAGSSNENKRRISDREKSEFINNIQLNVDTGTWHVKKKSKQRSGVWLNIYEVFDGKELVPHAYYCNLCHTALYNSYGRGNTTGLLRHTCQKTVDGQKKLIVRGDIKKQIKSAAANFVAKDLRPYSAVEGEGLFDLCAASMKFGQIYKKATDADLRDVLPSRNTVKSTLTQTANQIKAKIRDILAEAKQIGGFAITSDCWTDRYRRQTYICLVAHCNLITDKGIERHRYTLYVNEIKEAVKSKEVIVKYILDVLNDYGFEEDVVREFITFVTDRGSNVKYGLISMGFKRLNCYAHLIHNLVKEMCKDGRVNDMIRKAAKITAFVKKSSINAQLGRSMKLFSSTRWNGAFIMLDSFLKNFEQLSDLLYQRQRNNPQQKYFDIICTMKPEEMNSVCKFLVNFKELTDKIEGDKYETLSFVWPTYEQLKVFLQPDMAAEDEEASSIVEEMKVKGLQYFFSREIDFEPQLTHKTATVLNPLFKTLPTINEPEKREIYKEIKAKLGQSVQIEPEQNSTPITTQQTVKIHPFFSSFCVIDTEEIQVQPTEFENYLNHRVTSADIDCTSWWNENRKNYPELFKLFAYISCIPASSASGERIFSRAGNIVTNKRSNILPENVNNIVISSNKIHSKIK